MIEYLSDWFKKLIFLVILAGLVDMVLPNSNIQKYARMVLGLLIILTLLSPVLSLLNINDLSNVIWQNAYLMQQNQVHKVGLAEVEQMASNLERVNQQAILSRLKANLEQEIALSIRNIYEIEANVDVHLKVNRNMEANIDKIVVYLQGRVHKKDNEDNPYDPTGSIPSIPAVEIRIGEEKENVERFTTKELQEHGKSIRSYLTTNYHLHIDQVEVHEQSSRRNP